MIEFTKSFEGDTVVQAVHTEQHSYSDPIFPFTHRYHFCKWEEDTWFVVVLEKDTYLDVVFDGLS